MTARLGPADIFAIRAQLGPLPPTGEESPTCADCGEAVLVRDGDEWQDGDICHACLVAYREVLEKDCKRLADEVEALWAEREETR